MEEQVTGRRMGMTSTEVTEPMTAAMGTTTMGVVEEEDEGLLVDEVATPIDAFYTVEYIPFFWLVILMEDFDRRTCVMCSRIWWKAARSSPWSTETCALLNQR